jgi:hypothetical protein
MLIQGELVNKRRFAEANLGGAFLLELLHLSLLCTVAVAVHVSYIRTVATPAADSQSHLDEVLTRCVVMSLHWATYKSVSYTLPANLLHSGLLSFDRDMKHEPDD